MREMDNEKLRSENPSFWNAQRLHILDLVKSRVSENGRLTESQVHDIFQELSGSRRHPPKPLVSAVRNVLTEINELGLIKADLPAERIPIARPSLLPATSGEFSYLPVIDDMLDFLWTTWLAQLAPVDACLLGCAMTLPAHAGMGNPALHLILTRLKWEHIAGDGLIRMPFDPDDKASPFFAIALPAAARLLLSALRQRSKPQSASYVFLPDTCKPSARKKRVAGHIRTLYTNCCRGYCHSSQQRHLPTWSIFARVARLIPVLTAQLEPLFVTVSSTLPLPTAPATTGFMPLTRKEIGTRPGDLPTPSIPARVRKTPSLPPGAGSTTTPQNWCADARLVMARLVRSLKAISRSSHGKFTQRDRVHEAHAAINTLLEEADDLAPNAKSALHLALQWTRSRLSPQHLHNNPKVGAIVTDLSRIFTARLLRVPESIDLSAWETEEHETFIEEHLADSSLAPATQAATAAAFRQVYRFANANGYTDSVDTRFTHADTSFGTRRAQVLSPYGFDFFLDSLQAMQTRDAQLIAAACAIGYYAGLRAGEILLLTLNDVIIGDGEIWIQILRGKTPAARRQIPLHLLAPDAICDLVRATYGMRRGEFRPSANLQEIFLFGPEGVPDRYERGALIDVAITELQARFGADVVFHSLRHAFASWILVRWYALRYPDSIKVLAANGHVVFQPDAQERFAELFSLVPGQPPDPSDPSALVVISKLMGHLGQQTLFARYVHTFQILHADAMKRVDTVIGVQHVSGKVIAALLPRMASATTRAKHKAKIINDLLALVADDARSL